MVESLVIAKSGEKSVVLLPALANRHGLITGATGTGKTVTLQKMAEGFAQIGVPVFLADVKGDLTGLGAEGVLTEKLQTRLTNIGITDWQAQKMPLLLWDVFGEKGHPIRATISDIGPLLLARLLNLNETQAGVLQLVFKIADEHHLALLDFKDLRSMVQFVGENAKQFTTAYGHISTASIGAIQRGLLTLEQQGAGYFLGEPMLDIVDLLRTDADLQGVISILAADKLYNSPKLYSVFLLWLLSELFEKLPEVGDLDKPKLIFFFDEAHLLFNDISPALLDKIEQVVRLIRSKGVGIYFVSQNPSDIPESILGQLGNRVQHALRAFTPRDQKAVKAAAQTMRANPAFDAEQVIMELGVGEALISFLDEKGRPNPVERGFIIAPGSRMGALSDEERNGMVNHSPLYGKYEESIDRESAYELLQMRTQVDEATLTAGKPAPQAEVSNPFLSGLSELIFGRTGPRGGQKEGLLQTASKTVTRQIANQIGRQIFRGLLGGIAKKRR